MRPLHLALSEGEGFGWGICGRHLREELPKLVPTTEVKPAPGLHRTVLAGKVLHTLRGGLLRPLIDVRGEEEYGYTFYENLLQPMAARVARRYRRVFAGSTWHAEHLAQQGVPNPAVLIQGVDARVFRPQAPRPGDGRFVIFSGGKLELRKGQDLVIRAVAILQARHRDVHLLTAWYNQWPKSMETLALSPHIRFEFPAGDWTEAVGRLLAANGVDRARTTNLGLIEHESMSPFYAASDLGVFPNRCEAGTNLVLMEYMACGRPAIATGAHGHRDVLAPGAAIALSSCRDFDLYLEGALVAKWVEPSLDELVEAMEKAYANRDELAAIARGGAAHMTRFTWDASARQAVRVMYGEDVETATMEE